jgi:hypothetical protein
MKSRFRLFGLHLSASVAVLLLVQGALFLGWYRWPGWYLTGVMTVLPIVVVVDVVLGPLMTLIIANPSKSTQELKRDISVIAGIQLVALAYGSFILWQGRPLFYAFSENELSVVQAQDLDPAEIQLARLSNPRFVPSWNSLPRWIWAPLPQDSNTRDTIVRSARSGGNDVTAMPRYFKDWQQGLPELRKQLKKVDDLRFFTGAQHKILKQRMQALGFVPDAPNTMPMTGKGTPLLAVFDPYDLRIKALLTATP